MPTIAKPENGIPQRDAGAEKRLIDLSSWFNHSLSDNIHHKPGNTLDTLPQGITEIDNCLFDVRGLVQLAGKNSEEITTLKYPENAGPIRLDFGLKSLHFLHASAWNIESEAKNIGEYLIGYADGSKESIPLIYRENILDWWGKPGEPEIKPAWIGNNERTLAIGMHIRLFHLVWNNPNPGKIIEHIELVSNCSGPGTFVVAITADLN